MGNKQSPQGVLPSIWEQTFQFYSLLLHDFVGRREPSLLAPPVVYDWQAESSVPVLCPVHVCWDTVRLAIGQGGGPSKYWIGDRSVETAFWGANSL